MTTLIACAICDETPDLLHRLDHMTVGRKVLMTPDEVARLRGTA